MFTRCGNALCKPHANLASLVLRWGLAAIFISHGYLKLAVDWGQVWDKQLTEATQMAVAWGELVCGIALLLGFLSRLAAIGIIVMQVGAMMLYTSRYDFIHIEFNRADPYRIPTGTEYNFAVIVMCVAVVLLGSGLVSVDNCLFRPRRNK
jgi:uncharacterized membrane protein YphA (DoxX/SURF4 family)